MKIKQRKHMTNNTKPTQTRTITTIEQQKKNKEQTRIKHNNDAY